MLCIPVETLGSQLGDHGIFSFTLSAFAYCGVADHQYLSMFITCMISTKLDKICLIRTFGDFKLQIRLQYELVILTCHSVLELQTETK